MKYFTKSITLDEVKAAYRKQALRLHPDIGGSNEAMTELTHEFEIAFAIAKRNEPVQSQETAVSYQENYYAEQGWKDSRYNSDLTTTEVAKIIRDYVKHVYPTYKFSVTSEYFSGGSEILVALMETPVEITSVDMIREYLHAKQDLFYYVPSKEGMLYQQMSEKDIEEYCQYVYSKSGFQQEAIKIHWINPVIQKVIEDVYHFCRSYNYEFKDDFGEWHCNNFYLWFDIGKWDKPAKFVKRTAHISPTKQVKGAKRLTA